MKYKIGELEVEAIQWTGDNFGEFNSIVVSQFTEGQLEQFGVYLIIDGIKNGYKIGINLTKGEYLVIAPESLLGLSETEFNLMATKVKEPKFKAGDKVYYHYNGTISKFQVMEVRDGYYLVDFNSSHYFESDLLTLEEAIERLKEL